MLSRLLSIHPGRMTRHPEVGHGFSRLDPNARRRDLVKEGFPDGVAFIKGQSGRKGNWLRKKRLATSRQRVRRHASAELSGANRPYE